MRLIKLEPRTLQHKYHRNACYTLTFSYFVVPCFDELLIKLYVKKDETLYLYDIFIGFPTMEEIYEIIKRNDKDDISEAYSHWMTSLSEYKKLDSRII